VSYHLVIEGIDGSRRVREGISPRRGEWLSLEWRGAHWWLPVLEVSHALSKAELPGQAERGSDLAHERADAIVITSLVLGVESDLAGGDEFKLVLPPTRWPLGGFKAAENEVNGNGSQPDLPTGTKPKE
jgi:hypothetical protein